MIWERCTHGYNITPAQRCPWCYPAKVNPEGYKAVIGKGNGWLLEKDVPPCEACGGPCSSGWEYWLGPADAPTREEYIESLQGIQYCRPCANEMLKNGR